MDIVKTEDWMHIEIKVPYLLNCHYNVYQILSGHLVDYILIS